MTTRAPAAIDWERQFAERTGGLYGSMTRRLMSVLGDPEIISFGGGLPAWDLFPLDKIREITDELLRDEGPLTLQYSTSEGFLPFREEVATRYRERGLDVSVDNVMIDTGTMQGIDLIGKLFLEKGDHVVLGDPTFLTALQAFGFYQAEVIPIPLDEQGMQVDRLPEILDDTPVKFIYVMPTFKTQPAEP